MQAGFDGAERSGGDAGDFLDRRIPKHMAVMIVDDLETVEIDDRQRHFVIGRHFFCDIAMQGTAVRQHGQGIAVRKPFQLAQMPYAHNGEAADAGEQGDKPAPEDRLDRSDAELRSEKGQYRLSYTVTDAAGREIEGGHIFTIIGEGFDGSEFRFNDLEIVPDKRAYAPDDKVQLQINTNRPGAAVLLFLRPSNGVYLLGVSRSGTADGAQPVSDAYTLTISPGSELPPAGDDLPNNDQSAPAPVEAAFALSGILEAADEWYAWTLSDADAASGWELRLQSTVGLSGTVELYHPDGHSLVWQYTGPAGRAVLYDLALSPGIYRIREIQQNGWVQTTDNPADIVISDGGQVIAGSTFGNYQLATIS